jgi:hypothetical protein
MDNNEGLRPQPDGGPPTARDQAPRRPISLKTKPNPWSRILWFFILSGLILGICIIIPIAMSLAMRLTFDAQVDSDRERGDDRDTVLVGATEETYISSVVSGYKAEFFPVRLEDEKTAFTAIELLYGPILLTGTSLELNGTSTDGTPDFSSDASIRLNSGWTPVFFFIALILIFILVTVVLKKPADVLIFVFILSIIWVLWSLLVWAVAGVVLGPVNELLNRLLTEEQGSARYSMAFLPIMTASLRVFIVGIVVWFLTLLYNKAKSDNQHITVKPKAGSIL